MKKKMVVYITGCLGFIGSYITTKCLNLGWYVRGIDSCTYAANTKLLEEFYSYPNFTFEIKDINSIDFLYECDYIINTAAETHVGNSIIRSDEFVHSNINGVHHLLNLIKNYRQESAFKPTLLHFSTDEVYGDITEGERLETDILKPSNPYSATKAAADMLILAWARTYNIPYLIVRPTNNYGIGQYIEKLIPKTCKYLKIGKKVPLHKNGIPTRNWLHASDTTNAVITLIESEIKNDIFNISGGLEMSNIEVCKRIVNLYTGFDHFIGTDFDTPASEFFDFSFARPGEDIRYSLNDSKIRKLGWAPKAKFNEELKLIVEYYKESFIW
ncbi:MAG: GDP-mannose 4,6-dehydratase [Methanogenium sp.]|jgi:dTDP-glucose 4,6-dehydratase